ncbi:lysophospholipid acyltransferase family protein [Sphingomonas sp. ASV193]|uniref:lysophospholipid acyltransferase family protein n=1 Tax=Sphingomonas sp. ASV193 TaxID=3144405 RepID=UPI0032E8A74D
MIGWFRGAGWKVEGRLPSLPKFVLVGAPHTSNWDFLVFVGAVDSFGRDVHFIGKHSLFRWPMARFMRGLGGVPVDRRASNDLVRQMAAEFAAHDDFILVVAPEGTRSPGTRWRSGFYRIAQAAGVPMVCVGPDYPRRRAVIGPTIVPTGDYDADMAPGFAFFRTLRGLHPARGFIPD